MRADAMDHLAVLMVRSVRDGTGVDDAYIRLLALLGARVATLQERLTQGAGLCKIEFAS